MRNGSSIVEEALMSRARLRLFVDPFDAGDFWRAIPPQGKKRPSQSTIDIEPATRRSVMTIDSAVTAWREPECRHAWYPPLAAVAMAAEDQIDGVVVLQLIEDIRSVGQQEGVAVLCAWRQAA